VKRMLILAVTLWLGVSATAHAQVNSPTNTVSTVTGAIVPSGRGVTGATGGSVSTVAPVAAPCPFGVSLSANLTAFGCASDPLGAPTYQIPAEAGATAVTMRPVGQRCWRQRFIERALPGRDTVNGRQRRRWRSLRRHRRMLSARLPAAKRTKLQFLV